MDLPTSHEAARQVGEQILEYYEAQKGTRPSRFVLHKPSVFWEEEREGLLDATDGVRDLDLVSVDHIENSLPPPVEVEFASSMRGQFSK